ncbi:protein phosphatase CheZ [Sinimarinibacterium sp. NLF-5-8]|uniref:protein phosphatase CheZ n=1 Tax=Sinimarinibacterium sp. NLF-5-8 TaxID=2698684 RepID=UPI00137BE137|nr:protein phosphatase CheZ [Sinimarinibacterium sp. NLF-5-8]QHS08713.1 protein phosphatase CheZ [Sinimarinibacterium sp. NLF-5-8]
MTAVLDAEQRAQIAGQLHRLLAAFESGEEACFDRDFERLIQLQQQALFTRVALLTRELHNAVSQMRLDERLARIAGDDIPDARHRLDYVMQVTEKAAHRTLDLVEQARGVTAGIRHAVEQLDDAAQLTGVDAVRTTILGARDALNGHADFLRTTLSDLAQAQEYQDISGQIIKKVITLVRNMENALLELLRGVGGSVSAPPSGASAASPGALPGPAVPGVAAASQQDADALLAELGF